MRYYVNVIGGGALLGKDQGKEILRQISKNLREFRIQTGFDYKGFNLVEKAINDEPELTLDLVIEQLRGQLPSDEDLRNVRVLISNSPLPPSAEPDERLGLFIIISHHEQPGWLSANGAVYAQVNIHRNSVAERSSALIDVFQDIMIGNSDVVDRLLKAYVADGHTQDDFYAAKARFASKIVQSGVINYRGNLGAERYVSFSALARLDHLANLNEREGRLLSRLWSGFLETELRPYFFTPELAADVVRDGYSHDTRSWDAVLHGNISRDELIALFSDETKVTVSGCYILCILSRNATDGNRDKLRPLFGQNLHIGDLSLRSEKSYSEMIPHVKSGFVTPIRLYLRKD
jgi:hypothetical protein